MNTRDRKGHLHARRFTTSEDDLEVTQLPLLRTSSTSRPAPLRTRRASITQSDAKLYALAQVGPPHARRAREEHLLAHAEAC